MKNKIVTVIMGQNCEQYIKMCLDSVKGSDAIVYCDGGSKDKSMEIAKFHGAIPLPHRYDQKDLGMNGKQRNFYLGFVKTEYSDYWCLALDADEIVEDFSSIRTFINNTPEGVYSIKMRHLIGDLTHEDATVPVHSALNRLFKISCADSYPEEEHPVLTPKSNSQVAATNCTTVWHLAYVPQIWDFKKKYLNHLKKSEMHTPQFLKQWYWGHLFGYYPKTQFDPAELPKQLLDELEIDKDELYFRSRGLEHKHWIDAAHWKEFFKCKDAVEFGCGLGPRVVALNNMGVECEGFEISEFAVNNRLHKKIQRGDITVEGWGGKSRDLSIAYDLLEHIDYEDLNEAITKVINHAKRNILISVPVIGDPNLENDPTHKIRESKEWWIKQFTDKKCKLIKTPDHFLFKDQVLIFKVPDVEK